MRKIISQILNKNYEITKSSITELPKVIVRRSVSKPFTVTNGTGSSNSSHSSVSRSISMSSNPGSSIPGLSTSTSTPIATNIGPLLSSVGYASIPQFIPTTTQQHRVTTAPDTDANNNIVDRERDYWIETEKRRRSYYTNLLQSSVDLILTNSGAISNTTRSALISELNVKRVLSKNEEMKKVIFKVAAMALAQNEEIIGSCSLHPFIITAGEVFFGGSYNEMGLTDSAEGIQDILTPGILVLMLNTLFNGGNTKTNEILSTKQLLLAKALVETSAGYLLHRTVQETNHLMEDSPENSRHFERMHQGNKLATLTGDLLVVSLIKNVASTGNNQVLELVMNSLSEFSTTEIAKRKPFEVTDNPNILKAMKPKILAESIVFSKGFQSSLMLSGVAHHSDEKSVLECASYLGSLTGLLWKTNFDWIKLNSLGKSVENIEELNEYLSELRNEADRVVLNGKFIPTNHPMTGMMRHLIHFWGEPKVNFVQ